MLKIATASLLIPAVLVTLLVFATGVPTQADVTREGDLVMRLQGGVARQGLARAGVVPAKVLVRARFHDTDPLQRSPALSRIDLELPRRLLLRSQAFDRCPLEELVNSSEARAERLCGSAEVGRGVIVMAVWLPGQAGFMVSESLVAFNGRYRGRTAILAHVTSDSPIPANYVMVFEVSHPKGRRQTSLAAKVPEAANRSPRYPEGTFEVDRFALGLGRIEQIGEVRHSYISASCGDPAAPSGPPIRVSFEFADSRMLTGDLPDNCEGTRGVGGGK